MPVPVAPSSSRHGGLGWIVLGAGVVLVAGGAVSWVLRDQEVTTLDGLCKTRQTCPSSAQGDISDGKLYDALAVTLFVAGGVGALAGGGLLTLGPSSSSTAVQVSPVVTAHGGGLGLGGALW
jgi:hypothetical protein